jgi:amidase
VALLDDLAYTSATSLARLIREREVSPIEVLDATIDRIEIRDQSLNAVVFRCSAARSGDTTGRSTRAGHSIPWILASRSLTG